MTGLGYWLTVGALVLIAVSVACGARALYLMLGPIADLAAAVDDEAPPPARSRHAPAAVAAAVAATAERDADGFVEPPARRSNPATVSLPIDPSSSHGPLCRCGHYRDEHGGAHNDLGFYGCQGKIGDRPCTCVGFRAAREPR